MKKTKHNNNNKNNDNNINLCLNGYKINVATLKFYDTYATEVEFCSWNLILCTIFKILWHTTFQVQCINNSFYTNSLYINVQLNIIGNCTHLKRY